MQLSFTLFYMLKRAIHDVMCYALSTLPKGNRQHHLQNKNLCLPFVDSVAAALIPKI